MEHWALSTGIGIIEKEGLVDKVLQICEKFNQKMRPYLQRQS